MSSDKKRNIWSVKETETLINLIRDEKIMRLLDGKRSRNSDIYARLVGPMLDAGYERDVPQIRTKWKHLQQDYKKEVSRRGRSGASPSQLPHFERLDEILGSRAYVTYEQEGVDSGETIAEDDILDLTTESSSARAGDSPEPIHKKKKGKSDRILEQMQEAQEERNRRLDEFQKLMLGELKQQREWEEEQNRKFMVAQEELLEKSTKAQEELMARSNIQFAETLAAILNKK